MPTPRLILTLLVFGSVVFRDPGQLRAVTPRDEATPARASWVNRLKTTLGRVCDAEHLRPQRVAVRVERETSWQAADALAPVASRVSVLESRLPPPTFL